ncbi:leucine rich repeat protein [Ichthyophthirius multifiliis]|uniref:Leucine rich repeat protein n=1 Tax=Ichthyophthirius multifiliis TaxID=5932 RepID=G0QY97_ICHMU|nr:leucine rich repeat protein [Ichthyophthirius multifiliis]EGR29801.1 leucine rich repeat protein [Ichthyophthirius multifiliis]|eukprot:XP_004031037.1 leucine rich repeat protein [Ichthyophthirius multifiliis]
MSKMNINAVNVEDTYFFINLVYFDLSENEIKIEDLINFANLQTLILSCNKIQKINLSLEQTFNNLDTLDLSFNYLTKESISNLKYIPMLRKLILENNELNELPENMSQFQFLEELILDGNLFQSNNYASSFWYCLASIKKLSYLSLSRNNLRGIHTEKLVAGNFMSLTIIDFSYNIVENQHNLICARNFKSLQKLIITGNPFAMSQEHKGLEMEVYARTGGIVVNEEVEKYYLKQKNDKIRLKLNSIKQGKLKMMILKKTKRLFYGNRDALDYCQTY